MRLLRILYAVYALLVFFGVLLVLFIPMYILGQFKRTKPWGHQLVRLWGWLIMLFYAMPFRFIDRKHLRTKRNEPRVYVANHTSFLDIPSTFLSIPGYFTILGKASVGKVPLFGTIYKLYYTLVDRRSAAGRSKAMTDCKRALRNGQSVILFPEGTIPKTGAPQMKEFYDGAFRMAIELGVSIVPVAIPFNWKIFPDETKLELRFHRWLVQALPPIDTKGMTMDDIEPLKAQVYHDLQAVINHHNKISA